MSREQLIANARAVAERQERKGAFEAAELISALAAALEVDQDSLNVLKRQVDGLAERVARQAEIIEKFAEKPPVPSDEGGSNSAEQLRGDG